MWYTKRSNLSSCSYGGAADYEQNLGEQVLNPSETQGIHVPSTFLACTLSEGKQGVSLTWLSHDETLTDLAIRN
jgi:hypothetical protein